MNLGFVAQERPACSALTVVVSCVNRTETCGVCNGIFCPSCLSFHLVQHPKAASADHRQVRERKRA